MILALILAGASIWAFAAKDNLLAGWAFFLASICCVWMAYREERRRQREKAARDRK